MEIKLHRLRFWCPKCTKEVLPEYVEATARGKMNFYGTCAPCNATYQFQTSFRIILKYCNEGDKNKEVDNIRFKQITDISQEQKDDDQFLRDFHIDPDEPREGQNG